MPCYYSAAPGEVTRYPWRDVDNPLPDPPVVSSNDDRDVPAADVTFAEGFPTFERKAAAAELLRVARAMRFQLPSSEQESMRECGTKLLATRDDEKGEWDGHAAIAALREDHPPLSAQEAAGGVPARCEENSALAGCLDKLAR